MNRTLSGGFDKYKVASMFELNLNKHFQVTKSINYHDFMSFETSGIKSITKSVAD